MSNMTREYMKIIDILLRATSGGCLLEENVGEDGAIAPELHQSLCSHGTLHLSKITSHEGVFFALSLLLHSSVFNVLCFCGFVGGILNVTFTSFRLFFTLTS